MPEQTHRTRNIVIGLFIILMLGAAAWWYTQQSAGYSYQLAQGEKISTWNFQGAYTGNADLATKANDEITRLKGLYGNAQHEPTDYIVNVSIANQYFLLGDGKNEYSYLMKALAIDSTGTGLAWSNLGNLFEQLGAKKSALDAYARAVQAQSQFEQYQTQYLDFLTSNFPDNAAQIEKAFADAHTIFGDSATMLQTKAEWLAATGKIQEAIDTWKQIKVLAPASAATIDSEIQQLEKQL